MCFLRRCSIYPLLLLLRGRAGMVVRPGNERARYAKDDVQSNSPMALASGSFFFSSNYNKSRGKWLRLLLVSDRLAGTTPLSSVENETCHCHKKQPKAQRSVGQKNEKGRNSHAQECTLSRIPYSCSKPKPKPRLTKQSKCLHCSFRAPSQLPELTRASPSLGGGTRESSLATLLTVELAGPVVGSARRIYHCGR